MVIDVSAIPDIETTAAMALADFELRLARSGITLWFAAPTTITEGMLANALPAAGPQRIVPTIDAALAMVPPLDDEAAPQD